MICIVGCKCCSLPSPKAEWKRSAAVMPCRQCKMRHAFTQQCVKTVGEAGAEREGWMDEDSGDLQQVGTEINHWPELFPAKALESL